MKLPRQLAALPSSVLYLLTTLGIVIGLWALVEGLRLIPPSELTIAAGTKGSAYYDVAHKYQTILAKDGIKLNIIETAGSIENRDLIDIPDSQVDIALIQGGIATELKNLNALAAVFPEPLLAFARVEARLNGNPHSWSNKRIALGSEGSGTKAVVEHLLRLTKAPALSLDTGQTSLAIGGQDAVNALLKSELDLAFFVAPLDAPYLSRLINNPSIELLPIEHSQSLASKIPEAHYIELFSGAVVYEPSYPNKNIPLITLVTKLVASDDLHPALVNRLVRAVKEVHGHRIQIVMKEPFPNTGLLDMDADVYAAKLLRDGFNPLEKILPYWVVAQINRFALLLLPVIFILLPLFKLLPALLAWRMQSKVYRYYMRLHEIDLELANCDISTLTSDQRSKYDQELFEIEVGLRSESLPLKYRESAYNAVHHVQIVRARLI